MIDIRKLKELVRLMVNNDLTELDLRDSEEQVTLRRQHASAMPQVIAAPPAAAPPAAATQAGTPASGMQAPAASSGQSGSAPAADTSGDDADTSGLHEIQSPMVGTFYNAPNPDSPPFIKPGDHVTDDSVVCLVEAMKIFNEIKAECSGTVERILVKNAESVEFGQPLFLVRPD